MKGLGKRVLTSVVALPILIGLIGWVPWYGFSALVWVSITLSLSELFAMLMAQETPAFRRFSVAVGSAALAAMLLLWRAPKVYQLFWSPSTLWIVFLSLLIVAGFILFSRGASETLSEVPPHLTAMFFGVTYLSVCGAHIAYLARLPESSTSLLHGWVFFALGATFMTDTGGYFFGKFIGGPKMAPSVSPNKTWAGLLGCAVGAVGGSILAKLYLISALTWLDCVIIGVTFALIGQMGDLFMSLMKRAFKVKDTGSILPGHGGLLDRIDALLFTGPFLFYYAAWVVLPRVVAGQ